MAYTPNRFERVTAVVVAVAIVAFAMYLIARNEPFEDRTLITVLRILVSLATAILGAILPGFLNVSWKGGGLVIRAGGALALFLVTFFGSPHITDKLMVTHYYLDKLSSGEIKTNLENINGRFMAVKMVENWNEEKSRRETSAWLDEDRRNKEVVISLVRFTSEVHECIAAGLCNADRICSKAHIEIENFAQDFGWYFAAIESGYRPQLRAVKLFRSCDCYEFAREQHCPRLKEWCTYPRNCPFSLYHLFADSSRKLVSLFR